MFGVLLCLICQNGQAESYLCYTRDVSFDSHTFATNEKFVRENRERLFIITYEDDRLLMETMGRSFPSSKEEFDTVIEGSNLIVGTRLVEEVGISTVVIDTKTLKGSRSKQGRLYVNGWLFDCSLRSE